MKTVNDFTLSVTDNEAILKHGNNEQRFALNKEYRQKQERETFIINDSSELYIWWDFYPDEKMASVYIWHHSDNKDRMIQNADEEIELNF
jgi:hypothetical protein